MCHIQQYENFKTVSSVSLLKAPKKPYRCDVFPRNFLSKLSQFRCGTERETRKAVELERTKKEKPSDGMRHSTALYKTTILILVAIAVLRSFFFYKSTLFNLSTAGNPFPRKCCRFPALIFTATHLSGSFLYAFNQLFFSYLLSVESFQGIKWVRVVFGAFSSATNDSLFSIAFIQFFFRIIFCRF